MDPRRFIAPAVAAAVAAAEVARQWIAPAVGRLASKVLLRDDAAVKLVLGADKTADDVPMIERRLRRTILQCDVCAASIPNACFTCRCAVEREKEMGII